VKRSTLNFYRGDRKGAWWAGYGDRHDVWGLAEQIEGQTRYSTRTWGQARCPVYRSGTFNAQRSTLNFQRGDREGAWWAGYGDRHDVWGLAKQTEGQTRYSTRTWGQARCPVYRSGTFNVKHSTLNFQRGDRKGAWRGGIWGQTRNLDGRTLDPTGPDQALAGRSQPPLTPRYGDRHYVRYAGQERST